MQGIVISSGEKHFFQKFLGFEILISNALLSEPNLAFLRSSTTPVSSRKQNFSAETSKEIDRVAFAKAKIFFH